MNKAIAVASSTNGSVNPISLGGVQFEKSGLLESFIFGIPNIRNLFKFWKSKYVALLHRYVLVLGGYLLVLLIFSVGDFVLLFKR